MSGGKGTRIRPLTLTTPTTNDPKCFIQVLGKPFIEYSLQTIHDIGINDVQFLTQYSDNRIPLVNYMQSGERHGLNIHYSYPEDDKKNIGSASAILNHIFDEHNLLINNKKYKHIIALANDNLYYDSNFNEIIEKHIDSEAIITVLTINLPALMTIQKYGIAIPDDNNILTKESQWQEKPKNSTVLAKMLNTSIQELPETKAQVSTGGYLFNIQKLKELKGEKWIKEKIESSDPTKRDSFDIGTHLIQSLIREGHKVRTAVIEKWYDFGSREEFLDSVIESIKGNITPIRKDLLSRGFYTHDSEKRTWIHKEVLESYALGTEKLVKDLILEGSIKIGPNVRIGKEVRLGNNISISNANIDRNVTIKEGALINRAQIGVFTVVGKYCQIKDAFIGSEVIIESNENQKTTIQNSSIGNICHIPHDSEVIYSLIAPGIKLSDPHHHRKIFGEKGKPVIINHTAELTEEYRIEK